MKRAVVKEIELLMLVAIEPAADGAMVAVFKSSLVGDVTLRVGDGYSVSHSVDITGSDKNSNNIARRVALLKEVGFQERS